MVVGVNLGHENERTLDSLAFGFKSWWGSKLTTNKAPQKKASHHGLA